MALTDTAKLIAELTLDDKMSKGLRSANASLGKLEGSVARVGRGAGQLGTGLTRAGVKIAAAAGTGIALSAKAFIDWQDAFQGVVKTVDEADLNKAGLTFDDLANGLRAMAREMPNSADELAGIAASAGALGVKGKDILAFTKQVAILASTTNVSADAAATALGQMGIIIGLTADEFDNFAASLVDLGNKGNSTEADILEVERRAGGAAKLMHIAKDETLGWAAAVANLGLNQEAAGTALSSFFVKSRVAIAKNGSALDSMAETAGMSTKKFKAAFKKDATGALEDFIKGLAKLDEGTRIVRIQELFGKGSALTKVLTLLSGDTDNLTNSIDTSTKAWKDATAAQAEFDKRNATIKSGLQRLRNNLTDMAITLGEGVAPAIGRAAEKLSAFLKQDDNRNDVKKIGEDIGKAIDGIDWKEVIAGARDFVSVLRIALDYAKRIFDGLNALPTQVKGLGVGLIGLDKLSGGLVGAGLGNIFGGLAGALAKGAAGKVPGLGKLVAQPVFVTNWPVGGLGGGAGAAGAAGGMGKLAKVGLIAAVGASLMAVFEEWQTQNTASSAHASEIHGTQRVMLEGNPTTDALKSSLAAVQKGITDLQSNPLNVLVQGDALDQLRAMEAELKGALAQGPKNVGTERSPGKHADDLVQPTKKGVANAIKHAAHNAALVAKVQRSVDRDRADTVARLASVKAATNSVGRDTRDAGTRVTGATDRGSGNIVAAIHGIPAPIVNVNVTATTVTKSVTTQQRSGGGGTSRNRDKNRSYPD